MKHIPSAQSFDAKNTVDPESDAGTYNGHLFLESAISAQLARRESAPINTTGTCIDCSRKIARERIEALGPTVQRCLECQKGVEGSA